MGNSLDKTKSRQLWGIYLFISVWLLLLFPHRRRSIQWISTPLPDRVYAERSAVEGLPEWALLWWVCALLRPFSGQLPPHSDTSWLFGCTALKIEDLCTTVPSTGLWCIAPVASTVSQCLCSRYFSWCGKVRLIWSIRSVNCIYSNSMRNVLVFISLSSFLCVSVVEEDKTVRCISYAVLLQEA